jgi:hypothetical protein
MGDDRFERVVGVTAIAAAPLAIATSVLLFAAVEFDIEAVSDPPGIIRFGARAAPLLFWSMICDVLGFYLLLAPLALFLRSSLRARSPGLVDLMTASGLAYMLIGAMGASMLAFAGPPLIVTYAEATGMERDIADAIFRTLTTAVADGLWNTLEFGCASVWWVGTGFLLREQGRGVGWVGIVLGVSTFSCAVATIAGSPLAATAAQGVYLGLVPVWSAWLGADVLRGRLVFGYAAAPEA